MSGDLIEQALAAGWSDEEIVARIVEETAVTEGDAWLILAGAKSTFQNEVPRPVRIALANETGGGRGAPPPGRRSLKSPSV